MSPTPSNVRRRLLRTVLAAGVVLGLLPLSAQPSGAAPFSAVIPLSTIPDAPPARSGLLSNLVTWTVDKGTWSPPQGYTVTAAIGAQTWTFDKPVSLRFRIAGLQTEGECMVVPAGSVLEVLHPQHVWDANLRRLCSNFPFTAAGDQSEFTLPGPVTQLVLVPVNVGGNPVAVRGPTFIEVTVANPCAGLTPQTVPAGYNIILGTSGEDTLVGTPGKDAIFGMGGHDKLIGFEGDDLLVGGDGNDELLGGEGNDLLCGGNGNDSLEGNSGNDCLMGEAGNDSVKGQNGDDGLDGGPGYDFLDGGAGTNTNDGGTEFDQCLNGTNKNCEGGNGGGGGDAVLSRSGH